MSKHGQRRRVPSLSLLIVWRPSPIQCVSRLSMLVHRIARTTGLRYRTWRDWEPRVHPDGP